MQQEFLEYLFCHFNLSGLYNKQSELNHRLQAVEALKKNPDGTKNILKPKDYEFQKEVEGKLSAVNHDIEMLQPKFNELQNAICDKYEYELDDKFQILRK